jgi:hypothetical protein
MLQVPNGESSVIPAAIRIWSWDAAYCGMREARKRMMLIPSTNSRVSRLGLVDSLIRQLV